MRAALVVALAAAVLPALVSVCAAEEKQIPIQDAIATLADPKTEAQLVRSNLANMDIRAGRSEKAAWAFHDADIRDRATKFVLEVHKGVVDKLRQQAAGGQKTVSSIEMTNYSSAFSGEMMAVRDAVQKLGEQQHEAMHSGQQQQKHEERWREILLYSADARAKNVHTFTPASDAKRLGPVPRADVSLVEVISKHTGAKPGQDPSSNTGSGNTNSGSGGNTVPDNTTANTGAGTGTGGASSNGSQGTAPSPSGSPQDSGQSSSGATPGDAGGSGSAAGSANVSLAFGDVSGAKNDLNQAAKDGSADANAYSLRAELAMNEGHYSSAVQDAKQALQMDPKHQDALAILHNSEGRVDGAPPDESGSTLGTGASLNGGAGGGMGGLGGGFGGGSAGGGSYGAGGARVGAPTDAQLRAASALSGEQARKAAENAMGLGDTQSALAYVNRALAQDPRNPALLAMRSEIYARQRDYARAAADASAGLEYAPRDGKLTRMKSFASLRSGGYKDALAGANALIERDPRDAYAYGLRAHAYGNLGDRDAMAADLQRAAELDPRYAAPAAAAAAGTLQAPKDSDILFLFPGETDADAAASKPAEPSAGKRFGLTAGAAIAGGVLLALGLLGAVLPRAKDALSRLTRTGPSVGRLDDDDRA